MSSWKDLKLWHAASLAEVLQTMEDSIIASPEILQVYPRKEFLERMLEGRPPGDPPFTIDSKPMEFE